jgi:hypothetical protein
MNTLEIKITNEEDGFFLLLSCKIEFTLSERAAYIEAGGKDSILKENLPSDLRSRMAEGKLTEEESANFMNFIDPKLQLEDCKALLKTSVKSVVKGEGEDTEKLSVDFIFDNLPFQTVLELYYKIKSKQNANREDKKKYSVSTL